MYTNRLLLFFAILFSLSACKTKKIIIDGTTAYTSKQFALATELLPKELSALKTTEERYTKTLMIARAYDAYNNPKESVNWFEKTLEIKETSDIFFEYALELKKNEDYKKAIEVFEKIIQNDKDYEAECRRHIEICKLGQVWMNESQSAKTINVEAINSAQSDYAAFKLKDGSLVFTSDRSDANGDQKYTWTQEKYGDLYSTKKGVSSFELPSKYSTLNTNYYEGTACFNKDNTVMYFTRCGSAGSKDDYCAIYKSVFDGVNWSEPEKLPLLYDSCNVGQPFLSNDNKTLYFVSDEKGGFGGKDIYSVPILAEGIGEVSNLGTFVNTEADDMFPTFDKDNTLYFSSTGHSGLGGLDIFKATKEKTIWKNVENMRYPINSGADDFYLILDKTKPANSSDTVLKSGYLTSARKNGKGFDDIYSYELYLRNNFVLIVKVFAKKYQDPEDSKSSVMGIELLKDAKVELSSELTKALLTDENGLSKFDLEKEKSYSIVVTKTGYLKNTASVNTIGKIDAQRKTIELTVDVELEKIFTNKDIEISNIYYDLDKATLRPESFPALDSLLSIFNQNPDITVEIGSHTDSRGSDTYNLKLSQARAQSVVDYLISKGIAADRLIAKGYGETKLINNCGNGVTCTEEEHQRNRRTTFRVVGQKINIESK